MAFKIPPMSTKRPFYKYLQAGLQVGVQLESTLKESASEDLNGQNSGQSNWSNFEKTEDISNNSDQVNGEEPQENGEEPRVDGEDPPVRAKQKARDLNFKLCPYTPGCPEVIGTGATQCPECKGGRENQRGKKQKICL
jgi:hypothetical protein